VNKKLTASSAEEKANKIITVNNIKLEQFAARAFMAKFEYQCSPVPQRLILPKCFPERKIKSPEGC
jgi:hypothetical protein